jgi:hypothetical protein
MVTYGESSLPIVLEKHPRLRETLKVHLLEPMTLFSEPLSLTMKKFFLRPALWSPWGRVAAFWARAFNRLFVPAVLFDYLLFFHYSRGLMKSRKERGST